jgi:hypothetical protein
MGGTLETPHSGRVELSYDGWERLLVLTRSIVTQPEEGLNTAMMCEGIKPGFLGQFVQCRETVFWLGDKIDGPNPFDGKHLF